MISFLFALLFLLLLTAAVAVWYVGCFFSARLRARLWPSELPPGVAEAPPWWRYGDVAWRGFLRATPVTAMGGGTFFVLGGWCFMLLTSFGEFEFVSNQAARDWLGWGLTAGAVGMVAGLLVGLVVFLFNRPNWLVAPAYRGQAGAIEEWSVGGRGDAGGRTPHAPRGD